MCSFPSFCRAYLFLLPRVPTYLERFIRPALACLKNLYTRAIHLSRSQMRNLHTHSDLETLATLETFGIWNLSKLATELFILAKNGNVHGHMHACAYLCMHACAYVCMYVCMRVFFLLKVLFCLLCSVALWPCCQPQRRSIGRLW